MDKKVITILEWYDCYIMSLGVKGDTGDPGARGPRGLVGKMYLYDNSYCYSKWDFKICIMKELGDLLLSENQVPHNCKSISIVMNNYSCTSE